MTVMKVNSSSPASTTTSSTSSSSSSSSLSSTPNDTVVVSTSPRHDPVRSTLTNNLLVTAAIGAIGAAAIAALSSFWIASWSRRGRHSIVDDGDGGETALLLQTLSQISRRLEKLEDGDERGRGRRGSRGGRSGGGDRGGRGDDRDEVDAADREEDNDDDEVQDDAASAQSHGDNSVVKAAGSNMTNHNMTNRNNNNNRRKNQRSVRGMGLSQSMNAGAQIRSAVVQASGQNATTRPKRVSHAPDGGNPRDRARKAKHLIASTCATDHAVILDVDDDDIPDDISYTPNAPPQTILTKHHPPSHFEMASAALPPNPDLPDCDASHGHSHGHSHPTSTSASTSASHPLSEPVPVVLISDPGQDLDDEMMFIMARHLASLDLLSLRGVVANLAPSFARARLTRGTLDLLGLHRVPVGIGTDGGDVSGKHSSDQFEHTASSYIVQEDGEAARGLESGMRLLQRLYDEASDVEYVEVWDDDDEEGEGERVIVGVREMQDGDHGEGKDKGKEKEWNRHPHRRRPDQHHDKENNGNGGIPGVNIHHKMKRKSSSDNAKKTEDNHHPNSKSERKTKMVPRGGLVLVITSSLKDAAIFVRDNPSLFAAKTREVVIMGGCKPIPALDDTTAAAAIAASSLDDGDYLDDFDDQNQNAKAAAILHNEYVNAKLSKFECEPDSAHNNTFDTAASAFFYSQCQKMNVTLTVVSRYAAYAAKMPRSVYDDLALTGSSIGWRLRNSQRASIDQLWQRACSADPDVRKGLPPRCDRRWFIDTFCGGDDDEARCCEDTAWDLVTGFMQYDTIALLAAIPRVREKYFAPLVLPPFQAEEKEKKTDGARKRGSRGSKNGGGNGGKQSKSKDPSSMGNLAPEIQRMSESAGGRILFSRRSSDPGPGFLQRALAQANIDNLELETRKNTLPPLNFPTSRPPIPFERGTRNLIGVSDKEHNLKDPQSLIQLLETGYRAGILCNHHTQPHLILCLQLRWDNLADTLLTCLMLRSLWDMRLASVLGVVVSIYPSEAESTKEDGTDWSDDEKSEEDDQTAKAAGNAANANGRACGPAASNTSESSPKQSPSTLRALAESIRDTLRSIGLSHVKLLIVSGKTMQEHKATAAEALLELYEAAPPIGVSLVLTATFTSVWPFAESYPELFRDKTVRVVHTGGALVWPARWGWGSLPFSNSKDDQTYSSGDLSGELTEEKVLVPDPAAQNHRLDLSSARQFYKRVQALSVPMVILSRHVAKECCIPRHFFDVLGSHGGVVGKRICDSERNSLLNLWRCACAPMGSAARGNLPERCDAQWFADTFCAGREAKTEDDVWNYVEAVNLYSPIALLASLPGETLKSYFQTMPFTVRSATHHVIGLTEEVPPRNVRNPSELRSLVVQCFLSAALANESEFTKEPPPKVPIRMNHEQRSRVYNSRDSVLGNSVHSHISTGSNNMDDEDMWTFSEQARRELFSRTVVRTSKNLVMPKEKKRTFVSSTNNRDVLGFIPPQPLSSDNDTSSDEEGL